MQTGALTVQHEREASSHQAHSRAAYDAEEPMQNVDASAALVVPAGNSGDLLKQVCRRFQAQSRR